ncbi:hypothetical protein M0805_006642 [Coniferiporia weirii]|nr:hypothetical protein M0805_006642 [Coniferiporia weirii]
MAGRRHVLAVGRKSHEDKSGIGQTHRRASSEASSLSTTTAIANCPLQFLSPSSAANRDSRDSTFDIKKLFGDRHDKQQTVNSSHASSRARTPSPVPPSSSPPSSLLFASAGASNNVSASANASAGASVTMTSPPSSSKIHASPSKGPSSSAVTSGRTYDAKLVQREMRVHQLPSAGPTTINNSTASALTSASMLVLPTSGNVSAAAPAASTALGHMHGGSASLGMGMAGSDGSTWAQLNVHVLPLFNHEQLQSPIEDLNALVRRHIEAVMSRSPPRALATLEMDATDLINSGMVTLNAKLAGVEDDKLVGRTVEIWGFFWDQVLPYVEGVLLPLQTDALLIALHRTPKSHRPSSPTMQDPGTLIGSSASSSSPIDVRTIALRAFRDKIIVPIAQRLEARLLMVLRKEGPVGGSISGSLNLVTETANYQQPRLQQMLLVLHSQAQRARPTLSLTAPAFTPTPQELAVRKLLDALAQLHFPLGAQTPAGGTAGAARYASPLRGTARRAPSFLSGGAPRDRRGRVAGKAKAKRRGRVIDDDIYPPDDLDIDNEDEFADDADGDAHTMYFAGATPRGHFSAERERDRTFLESLRSPNPIEDGGRGGDAEADPERGHMDALRNIPGGWSHALGGDSKDMVDGHDDEGLNWDQAQAVVERMIGMGGAGLELLGPDAPALVSTPPAHNGTPTSSTPIPTRRRMT